MKTIENKATFMDAVDKEKFAQRCREVSARIEEIAPSDANILMSIENKGQQFVADIKVKSQDLAFSLQTVSRSAFMALEVVLKESLDAIHKWAAKRRI